MCENPYHTEEVTKIVRTYNPNYGDHRICDCGHSYYRHFDPYEGMSDAGCKYCACHTFEEDEEINNCVKQGEGLSATFKKGVVAHD